MKADDAIRELREAQEGQVDVHDLLQHILIEFGGNEGMAKILKKCFDAAPEGSNVQAKIASDIMKLVHSLTTGEVDDGLSEEDLAAEAAALMRGNDEGE